MPNYIPHLLVVALGAVVGACGSSGTTTPKASAAGASVKPVAIRELPPPPGLQSDGTYILSEAELALSCKKLAGRAQVRLLQIRDRELSTTSSFASRQMQKVATPVFGGTRYGADPDTDYLHDRAMVEAYNQRLAQKGCRTFDLEKELQPKPAGESPMLMKG